MAHKFFIALSSFALLLQAVQIPSGDVVSLASTAEHLTLTGALIIAVVILWRSNVRKDEMALKTTEQVTGALASSTASNVELRKANDELKQQVDHLQVSIDGWSKT